MEGLTPCFQPLQLQDDLLMSGDSHLSAPWCWWRHVHSPSAPLVWDGSSLQVEELLSAPCLPPCIHSLGQKVLEGKSCLKLGLMLSILLSSPFFSFLKTTPFSSAPGRFLVPGVSFLLTPWVPLSLPFHVTFLVVHSGFPHWKKSLTMLCASPQQDSLITSSPSTRSQRASTLE